MVAAALAMGVTLVVALAWRSAWAPACGALAGVVVALVGGAAEVGDAWHALRDLWRPLITIVSIMKTASAANQLGVFSQLAAGGEPRPRGPVRFSFRLL